MNNIFDYIKYYKNISFEEIKFNIMDALIYSILIYLPVKELSDGSSFKEMYSSMYSVDFEEGSMRANSIKILEMIKDSIRYKNIKIFNYIKNENEETQFGAMTIRNNEMAFVAFEGTNGTIVGWIENFYLSCNYPTRTQKQAINYLNKTIKITDGDVYIGGHSKGGNLAMASAMDCDRGIFSKIRKIYNFDGPGFRKEQFNDSKFKITNQKIMNILPDGSLIGVLLNNENYKFVKSSGIGPEKHNPLNWYVFGEFFVENKQTSSSKNIHESINKSVEQLNDKDMNLFIETLSKFLEHNNIKTTKDLKTLKLNDYLNVIEQIKDVDESTKKQFIDVIKVLINPTYLV